MAPDLSMPSTDRANMPKLFPPIAGIDHPSDRLNSSCRKHIDERGVLVNDLAALFLTGENAQPLQLLEVG